MLHGGAVLSGFVYFDADDDGTRDAAEVGVPGVVIRLSDSNSPDASTDQSTLTDDNGFYSFDELEPGTYQLSQRQTPATIDGQDLTSVAGAVASDDVFANLVLADDQNLTENNFGERGLRAEYLSIAWFFASSPPPRQMLRETIAMSEELAGDSALAESIRAGGSDVPDGTNNTPTARDDAFSVVENSVLTINAASGVLANDTDLDGDPITATLVGQAGNGSTTLNADGSFTYTPATDFSGADSFTYRASDGTARSNTATVRINVTSGDDDNQPFGAVTTGAFDDPNLRGIRTDLEPGAPAITQDHVSTDVTYDGFSNPPTYGPHHGVVRDAQNNFITPRPTGVYDTEQPDEDLVHNLEHGQVWISYNPNLLSSADQSLLEQFVIDGGTNTGVILTPRSENTTAIAMASWAHLQTLNSFDATQIREFIETNRGHSPEGFIPSGQKGTTSASETVDDGLPHAQSPNQPFAAVTPGSIDDPGLLGTRMDTQSGAAAFTLDHTSSAVDYTGFGNPPSYGPHHAVIRDSQGNSITPRPTGVYDAEQPDEDLVHNLEHGHVWISYSPILIGGTADLIALEQLVADGGTDTGVILTPRSKNTSPIVLTSLTRQLTLDTFDATTVRNFVNTNRGHSPEGFIPSGQRTDTSETLGDGLPHTPEVNAAPVAVDDGYSVNQSDVLTVASTSGVLANDSDADGDQLMAQQMSQPENGVLTLNPDGSLTYDPDAGFVGIDTFSYIAGDGAANSGVATVTIEVTATVQAVPDFTLTDVNPLSSSEGEGISPREYLQQVSGWYFGHST